VLEWLPAEFDKARKRAARAFDRTVHFAKRSAGQKRRRALERGVRRRIATNAAGDEMIVYGEYRLPVGFTYTDAST